MALAATSLAAGDAFAGVIYDNGGPNHTSAMFADTSYGFTKAADEFTLTAGSTTIGAVNWWGGCYPGTGSPGACGTPNAFTLYIYSNSSGSPGAQLNSFSVGNANQMATGSTIAGSLLEEYSYSATINLTLTAGTQYWLGISDTSTTPTWAWEHTLESGDAFQYNGSSWVSNPRELAFNLTSPVPEPGTFTLFGASALGLGTILRRRKAKT